MNTLRTTIKEWVKFDDEIKALQSQTRKLNQQKKDVSTRLLEMMKEQKIDEFDLNNDGKLVRQTKKTKLPLNKKTLLISLSKYYQNDKDALKVTEFLLQSRIEKINESLCKK